MKKLIRNVLLCATAAVFVWIGALFSDHKTLKNELIRLHVVANSDDREDQLIKLKVRDAITNSLQSDLAEIKNPDAALGYLEDNLPKLQKIANDVLVKCGVEPDAVVTLCKEKFGTRYYDTFRLPAGIYNALRITIGQGLGQNWWCVAFPALCQSATTEGFEQAAVEAGLTDKLTDTLSGEKEYQIRFYLLDMLGKMENMLFDE